jgi:hypothetical protein
MDKELKTQERMALIRHEVKAEIETNGFANAVKIGTDLYAFTVANGVGKVQITAIKDETFDVETAKTEYEFELAEKAAKAEEKAKEKAEKEAEREAKKAAKAKEPKTDAEA